MIDKFDIASALPENVIPYKTKNESMTLLDEMKQCLPIPVRPTKKLYRFLRKKGKPIEMDSDLNIIGVFDSGDMGGIICALDGNKKDQLVISLTQLIDTVG